MRHLTIGALTLLVAALAAPVSAGTGGATGPDVGKGIAAVRAATARYHDPANAIADGYVPTEDCVSVPGVGTMGQHWVNFGLFDTTIELTRPEALLYVPSPSGPRLVAVEWATVDVGQPHPSILGMPFDGPMPGHEPGMPVHYDLHAWVWQANPWGTFSQFNPKVSC